MNETELMVNRTLASIIKSSAIDMPLPRLVRVRLVCLPPACVAAPSAFLVESLNSMLLRAVFQFLTRHNSCNTLKSDHQEQLYIRAAPRHPPYRRSKDLYAMWHSTSSCSMSSAAQRAGCRTGCLSGEGRLLLGQNRHAGCYLLLRHFWRPSSATPKELRRI
jgi:hypothetical protein